MGNDSEESSPLLTKQVNADDKKPNPAETFAQTLPPTKPSPPVCASSFGWTADGLPLGHGSVVGEPMERTQWDSSLFACLGRNDEFCSSDLEVCLLGSMAPCVLYGGNAERLGSGAGSFANHCLPYTGLYLIGNSFFGYNCLAPWFSYPSRTAIRRKFNLELWNLIKFLSTPTTAPALFGGGLLGYVMYDVTHYYLHHGQPSSKVPRNLKKYHLNHHFRIQDMGFGITSSLWDRVFGTLPPSKAPGKSR